ncbi:hypothetical protein NFJ07_02990 [Arthrobacter sp. B2a2-09]|nr:hypothetical protein [Arthrobacter sp. B2a2-09]
MKSQHATIPAQHIGEGIVAALAQWRRLEILWAMLRDGTIYTPTPVAVPTDRGLTAGASPCRTLGRRQSRFYRIIGACGSVQVCRLDATAASHQ